MCPALDEFLSQDDVPQPTALREEDGASTVAFLEAAIPAERQHVQLEVDDEPAVPEEPAAAVPFVTWKSVFFGVHRGY